MSEAVPVDAALSASARAALIAKYSELIALREQPDGGDARPRLRALAARFPGALRELDQRPLEQLRDRLRTLLDGQAPRWAVAATRYHGWLRAALREKSLAAGLKGPRTTTEPWEPSPREIEAARAQFSNPPEGRVAAWVVGRVAQELGLDPPALAQLLFGSPGVGVAVADER